MEFNLEQKLSNMKGKKYSYNGETFIIKSFKFDDINDLVHITTDLKSLIVYDIKTLKSIIHDFQEVENNAIVYRSANAISNMTKKEYQVKSLNYTAEYLLTALERIETDINFISQAQAMCKIADSLVKLQLAQLKISQG